MEDHPSMVTEEEIWRALGIDRTKSQRGFARQSSEKVRKYGSEGGKKAHAEGKAHRFTKAEAAAAGAKGAEAYWAKWRAERAAQEAKFVDEMRRRMASESPAEAGIGPKEIAEIYKKTNTEYRQVRRAIEKPTVSKAAQGLAELALRSRGTPAKASMARLMMPDLPPDDLATFERDLAATREALRKGSPLPAAPALEPIAAVAPKKAPKVAPKKTTPTVAPRAPALPAAGKFTKLDQQTLQALEAAKARAEAMREPMPPGLAKNYERLIAKKKAGG